MKIKLSLVISALALQLPAFAADDAKQRQDLAAVIALQGKPCGEVMSYTVHRENDFTATCKDGNRYRVYVKDGRVVVEKQ